MLEKELLAVLALQNAKGLGDINAKKLIAKCGSASAIFSEKKSVLEKINGIGSERIKHLPKKENFKAAEKELKYLTDNNIAFYFFLDDAYPCLLKNCIDGPIILFKDGNVDLNNPRIISIVGTRKMTLYGRDFINQFVKELAPYNPIIVSGFAYGVDITAQKAAIENQLQTIGVLAHGFEQIYPKSHKKYVSKVNAQGGFFTEFWHDEDPLRENFLKRNRIVAGMSQATIIIESAERGGSLVTADIANSYSRDVFAVPGRVTDSLSNGCNELIKQNKAGIMTSAKDLILALNWELGEDIKPVIQKQLFLELQPDEELVYNYLLKYQKKHMDTIALDCSIPVYKMATLLFNLEMKGVVRPLQGKLFEVIN